MGLFSILQGSAPESLQVGEILKVTNTLAKVNCVCSAACRPLGKMDANKSVAKTGDQYLAQREGIQGGKTQEELEAQMGFLRKAPRK